MAFQITEEDIERSSTLEQSDMGRWAISLNGCIQFIDPDNKPYIEPDGCWWD